MVGKYSRQREKHVPQWHGRRKLTESTELSRPVGVEWYKEGKKGLHGVGGAGRGGHTGP